LKKEKLMKINEPASSKVDYKAYLKKSSNPLEGTASLLFLGYKKFLLVAGYEHLCFTPSCSVYAIESLQNDNPIKAYLKIFDRLQRCQPFVKQGEYEFVFQTQLYHDPAH
jgi:putative component of membrane protein insertase Oxa1/YidC/SpoIIIJ protein YidD